MCNFFLFFVRLILEPHLLEQLFSDDDEEEEEHRRRIMHNELNQSL